MAGINTIINSFEQTINEGRFRGQKFRYTSDTPRKVSVIDMIKMITGLNSKCSAQILRRILTNEGEVASRVKPHVFPGQGQRSTPVATAHDLLYIVGKLPSNYIGDFERERESLMTRYLGGDTSLVPEVRAIRAAQDNLAESNPDHPMRVFGEAVESGQVGNYGPYIDGRSEARAKSIEAYHEQIDTMRNNSATNNATSYIHTNANVSRAALGMFPRELRKIVNVKSNVSSRNYMDETQLRFVSATSSIARSIATESTDSDEYKARIRTMTNDVFYLCKKYNVHGYKKVESLPRPLIRDDGETRLLTQ